MPGIDLWYGLGMKLSIVMPGYNEAATIDTIISRVLESELQDGVDREIIVVDDGSEDGTVDKLRGWEEQADIRLILLDKNYGKGYAVRQGIEAATGDYVLIQDADLEYDPADIPALLDPVLEGRTEVVYGSRFLGPHRNMFFWHMLANKSLTLMVNVLFDSTLSDMEVGYKLIKKDLLDELNLREDRFGIEPEITAKILKRGIRIYEVPISYFGREYHEGKKITWKDGVRAVGEIIKYRFVN